MQTKNKYKIASASKRIFARIFDVVLLNIIIFLIFFLIVLTDNEYNSFYLENTWKYAIVGVTPLLFSFLYFVVIPTYCHGYTLFSFILKIKTINQDGKHIFHKLFKKELVLTFVANFITLSLTIFLSTLNSDDAKNFIVNFNSENPTNVLFSCLFTVYGLIIFFVFVNTIYRNGQKTLIDDFTGTTVINSKPATQSIQAEELIVPTNNNMPGIITEEIKKEIENI